MLRAIVACRIERTATLKVVDEVNTSTGQRTISRNAFDNVLRGMCVGDFFPAIGVSVLGIMTGSMTKEIVQKIVLPCRGEFRSNGRELTH